MSPPISFLYFKTIYLPILDLFRLNFICEWLVQKMNAFCGTGSSEIDTRRQANMLIELLIKANQAKNGLNGVAMDCIEERRSYPTTLAYEESPNLSQPVWSSPKQHCTQASPSEEQAPIKLSNSPPDQLLLKKNKEKSFHIFPARWSAKVAQVENEDENSISTTDATEAQNSVSPESDIKQEATIQIAATASPLTQSAKGGRKSSSSAQQQQFNFGKCKVCKDKGRVKLDSRRSSSLDIFDIISSHWCALWHKLVRRMQGIFQAQFDQKRRLCVLLRRQVCHDTQTA